MLTSLIAGFALGLSLIVAIGAQNLFVLRQGVRREHVFVVATVCAVSDAILIALGVSGIGLVLQTVPWLVDLVRWAGAAFLLAYGLLAARRAWRPGADGLRPAGTDTVGDARPPGGTVTRMRTSAMPAVVTVLALTWLNPHVYLDTVFLLGSIAHTHGDSRWWFALGACGASIAWFFALAYGARFLSRWLSTPAAWRILDTVIAVVMIALAVSLVLPR